MKILLAYYRYSPHTNGPSTYIDTLRKDLENKGHTVDLLSHDQKWLNIQIANQQTADKHRLKCELIHRFQTSYTAKYPLWIYWREMERYSLEQAVRQLDLNGYDLIHCHDFMTGRAMARSKSPRTPLIVSLHNFKFHETKVTGEFDEKTRREQQYMKIEEYLGAMSGDLVAVPCKWLKNQLIQMGVTPTKIEVIPYGIVKEPYTQNKKKPAKQEQHQGKKIILCPARLVPVKGHRYLIEALSELRRDRDDFHCLMAGEGPELHTLQQLTDKLGAASAISFLGKRHDIPQLMNDSDIIVLPSLHDTFPLVLLEGQFSAKPILAANAGGIKEIISDGADGMLVPSADSEALAEKLRLLLDDEAIRLQLGKRALDKAIKHWDISFHMASLERLYERCKAQNRPSHPLSSSTGPDLEILNQIDPGMADDTGFILAGEIPPHLRNQLGRQKHYIHVYDLSGVLLQTKALGPEGAYEFHHLPAGSYVLKSTLESFGNQTICVGRS
ncbi:glycosyltransferase [Bacillus swezeyi]|uniref:Glycosyltransferase family 1 protein n=1 Tax=Bacillus swezeyi TaxID=1925020 RepID=A0A1R1RHQ3_9BACI|nr:glycosyltransferase [Bacillus swezeyi]MEC1262587.1 glycosyltransferase [Bacillus swezeyi]MED2929096.1 glycosyltransferase [Bacillus swezeyi]MED2964618.1 glycosyltransferase [Bacillus swezeyi]MED3072224.1 glycosyltransferase [Bacillus swezeyi]MED3081221.1 glycosyltransferase [Bacillus swezeyi]